MHITSPAWMVRALQKPRGQGAPEMQAVELTMGGKPGTRNDVFSSADKYHQVPWSYLYHQVPHQGSCSPLRVPGAQMYLPQGLSHCCHPITITTALQVPHQGPEAECAPWGSPNTLPGSLSVLPLCSICSSFW